MHSTPEKILERIRRLDTTDLQFANPQEIMAQIVSSSQLKPHELIGFRWPESFEAAPATTPVETNKIHLIFGSGLAQNTAKLQGLKFADLFILEPDPGLLCLFIGASAPEKLFPGARLHFFHKLDKCLQTLKEVQNFWRTISYMKLPDCVRQHPEIADRLQKELDVCNAIAGEEGATIEKHYFTWAAHENLNLKTLLTYPHASCFNNRYQNVPALLIGAGPSLAKALPTIRDLYNCQACLIVAASTSLRALEKAGIIPDFTIIIEGKQQSHFDKLNQQYLQNLTLLAALKTHPTHLNYNFKNIYWFHNQTSPTAELVEEIIPEACPLTSSGNVINEALQFVISAGCNPVVLSGCDLAFKNGVKYAAGLEKTNGDREDQKKIFFPVAGNNEAPLTAPPEFIAYARSLTTIISQQKSVNKDFRVINISTGGMQIKECETSSPEECQNTLALLKTKKNGRQRMPHKPKNQAQRSGTTFKHSQAAKIITALYYQQKPARNSHPGLFAGPDPALTPAGISQRHRRNRHTLATATHGKRNRGR